MKIALALVALASTTLAQQIVIPPHASVYNGFSLGMGLTAQVDFVITTMGLPLDAFQAGDTASYAVRINGTIAYHTVGNVGSVSPGITIFTGDVVEIVGNWSAPLPSNFTAHNSSGGPAPFASTILGVAHNLSRAGVWWDIGDLAGSATASWFVSQTGNIGRVLVDVAPLGSSTVATVNTNGTGCTSAFASFYERMAPSAFDLTNTDLAAATVAGAGYVVQPIAGAGPLPVGGVDPLGGTVLVLPGDGQVAAGTLGMSVGSNGWVALGGGNSNAFAPTANAMLGNPSEGVYCWTDLAPDSSGVVTYEEDIVTGQTRTTFDGVYSWSTADPVYIQFDYNVNSGDWVIRIGVVGSANPEDWLVGYSPAGASTDPGMTDISAAAAILTEAADILPLTLTGIGRPIMGPVAVSYDVTTSNIEAGALIHVGIVGLTSPGTPMSALGFGSGDCFLNSSVDFITGVALLPVGDQTWTAVNLPIVNPALNGFEINCQAATFDLSIFNSAGRSSNGLKLTIGDV